MTTVHKNYNMDPAKNPFHKILIERGFKYESTAEKPNRYAATRRDADYIEHVYRHPTKPKDHVRVWLYKDGTKSFHQRFEQENGIIAPSYGDTKPQLVKALNFDYGEGKMA